MDILLIRFYHFVQPAQLLLHAMLADGRIPAFGNPVVEWRQSPAAAKPPVGNGLTW
jgi:hypothetical protein